MHWSCLPQALCDSRMTAFKPKLRDNNVGMAGYELLVKPVTLYAVLYPSGRSAWTRSMDLLQGLPGAASDSMKRHSTVSRSRGLHRSASLCLQLHFIGSALRDQRDFACVDRPVVMLVHLKVTGSHMHDTVLGVQAKTRSRLHLSLLVLVLMPRPQPSHKADVSGKLR